MGWGSVCARPVSPTGRVLPALRSPGLGLRPACIVDAKSMNPKGGVSSRTLVKQPRAPMALGAGHWLPDSAIVGALCVGFQGHGE